MGNFIFFNNYINQNQSLCAFFFVMLQEIREKSMMTSLYNSKDHEQRHWRPHHFRKETIPNPVRLYTAATRHFAP